MDKFGFAGVLQGVSKHIFVYLLKSVVLRHELSVFSQVYSVVGGAEVLLGETLEVARKVAQDGAPARVDVFAGLWHDFPMYAYCAGAGPPLWQAEVTVSVIALTWTFKLGGPENYVSHVNFGFLTFWMGTVHSYSM